MDGIECKAFAGLLEGVDGLDVESGINFCGSFEDYFDVLSIQLEKEEETRKKIDEAYNRGDWENYTIFVHGIKGTMISFGAGKLAEVAKAMEAAGKDGDLEYIRNHHRLLVDEFDAFIFQLRDKKEINSVPEKKKKSGYATTIDAETFDRYMMQMEDAVYNFDADKMLQALHALKIGEYRGIELEDRIEPIERKVEMADYISAMEAVRKLRQSLEFSAERGGEA